jgi:hypothetical protein
VKQIAYRELERAGRLGNQLWQIASTLGFARAHDTDPLFPEGWSYRPWFSLPDGWFGDAGELRRAVPAQKFSGLPRTQAQYLQQFAYIEHVMDEVQAAFAPSRAASEVLAAHLHDTGQAYLLDLPDAITLHVRRGDNTDPTTHPVGSWPLVTTDYYRKALCMFDATDDGWVVIFSDDPDWCRNNALALLGDDGWGNVAVVHSGPTRAPDYEPAAYAAGEPMDWIDLQLMGMFSRHIIANSSYSLWGALLGPGPTVYPNNWVGWRCRASLPGESTMVPAEWVMVDNPVGEEHLRPC